MESVFVASWGKSFRTQHESDLISENADCATLSLDFESGGRAQQIVCRFFRDKRKELEINGIPVKKAAELFGRFAVVLFVPSHLEIVRGAPDERRRFLDIALCREKPKALSVMNSYKRALEQRNRVLKDMRLFSGLDDVLSVWDSRLAEIGGTLSGMRAEFCSKLSAAASEIYSELAGGEELFLEFEPGGGVTSEETAAKLRDSLGESLRLGYTTVGAHRDDIKISVGGRDGRRFASQGQQRSAVIAMKLAEAQLLGKAAGEPPVLLLDDVLSDLDSGRRSFLLDKVSGMQRIVTACEGSQFSNCVFYEVDNGVFTRK